jgi:hypothetical protein
MPDTHYENQAVVAKAHNFSLTKREADPQRTMLTICQH